MFKEKRYYFSLILLLITVTISAQKEEKNVTVTKDTIVTTKKINALSPAKAAFYSAILPGLGQAYNKKYWKIPIVYGALGTSIYFYSTNNSNYKKYRNAFKLRKNGRIDPYDGKEGRPFLSEEALKRAQKGYKKDRDLSLLVAVGFYILQIVEASTNAHLLQHDVNDNLSIQPQLIKNEINQKTIVGATINFNF